MVRFTVKEVTPCNFDLVINMTPLDALKIKKIFNVNLVLAKSHGIITHAGQASDLIGLAFNWFSVIDACIDPENSIDILIPKDAYDTMLWFMESEGFKTYSYEANLCEPTCTMLVQELRNLHCLWLSVVED